jgi:plasmid stabilization system protein ParE
MRRRVILKADAEADLKEAVAWYNGQRKGLGKQFNRAVRATLTQLAKVAEAHAKIYGDVRQARVAGFQHYVVHYIVEPAQVTVFSVFHTSRDPRTWQSRVDDSDTP